MDSIVTHKTSKPVPVKSDSAANYAFRYPSRFLANNEFTAQQYSVRDKKISVQSKLEVSQPNDVYEQEADFMADAIMRNTYDKDNAIFSNGNKPSIQCFGGMPVSISPDMETQLNASRGGGHSLPDAFRSKMENSFGADFTGVRIHTDTPAAQMSRDVQAKAFTHGNDIYFNSGQYQPDNSEGEHLLAHELTHVLQQSGMIARKANNTNGGNKRQSALSIKDKEILSLIRDRLKFKGVVLTPAQEIDIWEMYKSSLNNNSFLASTSGVFFSKLWGFKDKTIIFNVFQKMNLLDKSNYAKFDINRDSWIRYIIVKEISFKGLCLSNDQINAIMGAYSNVLVKMDRNKSFEYTFRDNLEGINYPDYLLDIFKDWDLLDDSEYYDFDSRYDTEPKNKAIEKIIWRRLFINGIVLSEEDNHAIFEKYILALNYAHRFSFASVKSRFNEYLNMSQSERIIDSYDELDILGVSNYADFNEKKQYIENRAAVTDAVNPQIKSKIKENNISWATVGETRIIVENLMGDKMAEQKREIQEILNNGQLPDYEKNSRIKKVNERYKMELSLFQEYIDNVNGIAPQYFRYHPIPRETWEAIAKMELSLALFVVGGASFGVVSKLAGIASWGMDGYDSYCAIKVDDDSWNRALAAGASSNDILQFIAEKGFKANSRGYSITKKIITVLIIVGGTAYAVTQS